MDILYKDTVRFTWQDNYSISSKEDFRFRRIQRYFGSEGKILDIGCRSGSFQKYLQPGHEYYGMDFIPDYKKYIPRFIHHDITSGKFPIENDFFDYVYLGEVLEHVSNFFFVFEEVYRILKPGGLMLLTVPNNFNISQALGIINSKKYKRKNLDTQSVINFDTHIHSLYEPDILKICQLIGYKPSDCDRFYNKFYGMKLPEISLFKPFAGFIMFAARK